jgi:hypothetical protein
MVRKSFAGFSPVEEGLLTRDVTLYRFMRGDEKSVRKEEGL